MFQHILLPTDGSQLSRETAERAVAFAKAANASDHGLVREGRSGTRTTMAIWSSRRYWIDWFRGRKGSPRSIWVSSRSSARKPASSAPTLSWSATRPWEAIVNVAEDNNCDLIFMSKHGRGGLSSLLLGSETYRVLTHSSIPVLVYRPPEVDASRRKAKEKAREKDRKRA
jgi:nucleotide-binding universal stress UspA family protein